MVMQGCVVHEFVRFQSGGHNDEHEFAIIDTRFESFVDFEDCWFTGPFRLENVTFAAGTNLLGNLDTPVPVSFDVPPIITNTRGTLDMDTYRR